MLGIHARRGTLDGYNLNAFIAHFDNICEELLEANKAKSFAFIFVRSDDELKKVLRNRNVFTALDRVSGDKVDVFYLRTGGGKPIEKFNERFLARLGLSGSNALPCVAFFKIKKGVVTGVKVSVLRNPTEMMGAAELKDVIESYIAGTKSEKWKWLRKLGPVGEKLSIGGLTALVTATFKYFVR